VDPVLGTAALWLVMLASHIGLASRRPRTALVARLGEQGYLFLFSLVAGVCFTALVRFYTAHRFEGPPGLALGSNPLLRVTLISVIVLGVVLAAASLLDYPRSPMAIFGRPRSEAYGVERITRHSFFVAMAMIGGAHVLLAPHLIGAVFTGGFAVLGLAGSWHQDRKLLRLRGEPYAAYVAVTSTVPFAAILAGRQRLVPRELPLRALAAGLVVAAVLRAGHGSLFANGGFWILAIVLGGAGVQMVQGWRRGRRAARVRASLVHGTL
jgi:uncharacterized membrane protein